MKPEEAIKIIEVAKAECEWNAPLEYQGAFDAAIDALEKQIQKPSAQPESNCFGCKHVGMWENEVEYGYPSPCTRCKRRANDNYEQ